MGNEEEVDKLNVELESLQEKLEDAENKARRDNLRIRGIPEAITDLQGTATAFFQELAPEIPLEHLELDRIHRPLAPKPTEGPPETSLLRFIIIIPKRGSCKLQGTPSPLLPG